jgi:hypothetical protein
VKGFIRHDIFMQRTYHDFADEMRIEYGAGLEGLFDWHAAASGTRATESPTTSDPDQDTQRRPA